MYFVGAREREVEELSSSDNRGVFEKLFFFSFNIWLLKHRIWCIELMDVSQGDFALTFRGLRSAGRKLIQSVFAQ